MIIIGASGFARDLLNIIDDSHYDNLVFYDDVNLESENLLYGRFPVLRNVEEFRSACAKLGSDFSIGIGGTTARYEISKKFQGYGGSLVSLFSGNASIGSFGTSVGVGTCILHGAYISNDVEIGIGCLINKMSLVAHNVKIGNFCEISPGAKILGRSEVGDQTSIGTNAVILPDIKVGNHCRIGAGAIVTKSVPDDMTVVGMPAKSR